MKTFYEKFSVATSNQGTREGQLLSNHEKKVSNHSMNLGQQVFFVEIDFGESESVLLTTRHGMLISMDDSFAIVEVTTMFWSSFKQVSRSRLYASKEDVKKAIGRMIGTEPPIPAGGFAAPQKESERKRT